MNQRKSHSRKSTWNQKRKAQYTYSGWTYQKRKAQYTYSGWTYQWHINKM